MNERVSSIVDALFQDVVWTEEVKALHDELMDNCQARYADLLREGISEENAINAVKESLNGMEDVIGKYPKKDKEPTQEKKDDEPTREEEEDDGDEEDHHDCVYDAWGMDTIRVLVSSADVRLVPSADEKVHVTWEGETGPVIDVTGGTLNISQPEKENQKKQYGDGSVFSGKSIWNRIRQKFEECVNSLDQVTVSVPENAHPKTTVITTSGDLRVHDVSLTSFSYTSSSGDIDADRVTCDESMTINTALGDVKARHLLVKEFMKVDAVSGDVLIGGTCPELTMTIVSGDGDVDGHFQRVQSKCINGDMILSLGKEIQQVTAKSTNGDITVYLPAEIEKIHMVQPSSRREIHCTDFCLSDEGPAMELKTLAGDIAIRSISSLT